MDALDYIFLRSFPSLTAFTGSSYMRKKLQPDTLLQPNADCRNTNGLTDFIDQPDALSLPTPPGSHYRRLRRNGAMHSFLQKSITITINTFSNIIMFTPLLLSYITIISQTYKSK